MKRILAIILIISTLLGVITCLSGCSGNSKSITKGELLDMICGSFGMYNYTSDSPHTETVKKDNKYFTSVQAAYEWEIIEDKQINTEEKVNKDFLSAVLVKSVGFINSDKMSSEEITKYAVENSYVDFSYRGRTDGIRNVTYDEAKKSINKSVKLWSEKKYSAPKEEVTYGERTLDFTKNSEKSIANSDGSLMVPSKSAETLKEGDTYIAKDATTGAPQLYQVKNVETNDGYTTIVPEEKQPGLETSIQELEASGSITPDLSSCRIVDGVGNIVGGSASVQSQSFNSSNTKSTLKPMVYNQTDYKVEQLAEVKGALNFEIDGLKITGSISNSKISFKAKGDIYTNKEKTVKVSIEKSYDVKDISLDYDYSIEWFQLKHAYAKLNYTTVDTTKVGIKYKDKIVDKDWAFYRTDSPDIAKSIQNKLSKVQGKVGKTIKICDVPVYTNGIISFDIIVKLKISVSGEVKLVVTTSNAKGIEYKNGNIRYIKEEKRDVDFELSAKAELTLYIGAAFKALGINIVGLGIEGGLGAKGSVIIHVVDQENHLLSEVTTETELSITEDTVSTLQGMSIQNEKGLTISLNPEICFDYKVYGILKFVLDDDSVIGKIFEGSEIEIFGEKNCKFDNLSGHIEDGKNVKKCTRKYQSDVSDDKDESESSDTTNNDSILSGAYLDIETYFLSLSVGENMRLKIDVIPAGYEIGDVIFNSSNNQIAEVDSNGKITAVSPGDATVTVQTKDGKYKQNCSVYVIGDSANNIFVPLADNSKT